MRHLMSPLDFSVEELDELLNLANDIEKDPKKYAHACDGKKLATCFYEPSTRTRLSFEAAMLNLGGSVLGFPVPIRVQQKAKAFRCDPVLFPVTQTSVRCVIKEGSPSCCFSSFNIPVINAGDGGHQHPTQTLTDLLTISRFKSRLDNLTIGLMRRFKVRTPFTL